MTYARQYIIATLLALAAVPAIAKVPDPRLRSWNPPPAYDHPYAGRMVVDEVPLAKIRRMRPGHWAASRFGRGGICIVTIPSDQGARTARNTLRHERCNGWPHHYPR